VPRYNLTSEGATPSHPGDFAMTATTTRNAIERTEHPHVIKGSRLGGQPRIDDQRISVLIIFDLYRSGTSVEEILADYPTLTPAQVHDAISYAYDHPEEMDYWSEQGKLRNVLKDADMVYVEGRLIPRKSFQEDDGPPGGRAYTRETLPQELDR
jgi:uncharacterized protein (DUF433 family)